MQEIQEAGTTVIVVSHNLGAVRQLCPRTVVLHDATVRHDGATEDGISLYHQLLGEQRESLGPAAMDRRAPRLERVAAVERVELVGPAGPTAHVEAGAEVVFAAEVFLERPIEDAVFGLSIGSESGVPVYSDSTPWREIAPLPAGRVRFEAAVRLALPTGTYSAVVSVASSDGVTELAALPAPVSFYVAGRRRVLGVADLEARLTVRPVPAAIAVGGAGTAPGAPTRDEPAPPRGDRPGEPTPPPGRPC
jgi:ABC-type uncharacterized transport system ATPase subunit